MESKTQKKLNSEIRKLRQRISRLESERNDYLRTKKYSTIIQNVIQTIHKSIDLTIVLNSAVFSMNKYIENADNVSIYLVEGENAVLKAHKGYNKAYIKKVSKIPYPKGYIWKTINNGKQLYCADTRNDNNIGPAGRKAGTRSYASKPIRLKGKTVGAININSLKKDAFDREDLKLLKLISKQIEIAINNAKTASRLIEEKAKAQRYIDTADVIMLVIDNQEKVRTINKKGCEVLGYKEKEMVGKNWFNNFLPKQISEEVKNVHKKLLKGEIEYIEFYENVVLTKEKKERIISWHNSPITDENGRIISTLSSGIDVTEQKFTEEKFSLVFESSPNGILMTDKDGRINLVNKQIESQFGYGREEIVGKKVEQLVPKGLKAKHRKYRAEFLKDPKSRKMGIGRDLYALRKNGKEFPVEIGLNTMSMGDELSIIATIVDITERKLTEKTIVENERMLNAIINNSTDAIFVFEDSGDVITYNNEAEKFFRDDEEEKEFNIWQVIPSELKINFSNILKNAKSGTRVTDSEMELVLSSGERLSVSLGLIYINNDEGGMFIQTVRDITERVKMRNKILEFEKAQIISKMAEGIAHHMGTPLASMLLRIQMVKEDISDLEGFKDILEKLSSVESQIFYGQRIMQNLLRFANDPQYEKCPVNISYLIREAVEITKPIYLKSNISVDFDMDIKLNVLGNANMLELVLSDLIMNSIDAMPDGGKIRFKTSLEKENIKLVISDTGLGIPKEVLPYIFEPFFTTKPSGKGTGLGLAVAKRIIRDHNGDISIETTEGKGTDIIILIPAFNEVH